MSSHSLRHQDGKQLVDTRNTKYGRGVVGFQRGAPQRKVEFRNVCLKLLGGKPIFNGKDLSGWKVLPGHKSVYSVTPAGELNVKDGNGDLVLSENSVRRGKAPVFSG